MVHQGKLGQLQAAINKVFVGKAELVDKVLICLLAGGHVLLEDVPGVGKTTLAKTLARSMQCSFGRIQFTPDTLPGDIVGMSIFNMKTGEFEHRDGVVMHQILLADEINRTSPKTHAALLEAMAEGQVTVDGEAYPLPQHQQLNVNHPSFYAFVNSPKEEDEERWEQVLREYVPSGDGVVAYEALVQRRREIRECYLPETKLSGDVRAYLDGILEGADTDVEKLIAMEEALWQLEYTLTPGALPENVTDEETFLDYFLLESKKGYCSYFATAFVLLARAEGIPARYVEGFCIPVDSDKTVTVYSYMAHAWPEVYLDGVGWMPFEPTPGYEDIRYTPWEPVSETAKNVLDVESLMPVEEEEAAPEMDKMPEQEEEAEPENVSFVLLTVTGIVACVAVFLCLDSILRRRRFQKLSPADKFRKLAMNNLWLLTRLGISRCDDETLEEMQAKYGLFYAFMVRWEDATYGDKEITEADIALAETEQKEILTVLKEKSVWRYYLAKLRM